MAVEEFDPEGFFSLQPEELGSERNAITSAVAGINTLVSQPKFERSVDSIWGNGNQSTGMVAVRSNNQGNIGDSDQFA